MIIKPLASSSKGNCYLIQDGISSLLIECGVNLNKVREYIKITDIDGCLISHEHLDHSKYAKELINYCNIYTSKGTISGLKLKEDEDRIKAVENNKQFKIGSTFFVTPFLVQHDCKEPFGYLIYSAYTNEKLLFLTDTFYVHSVFKDLDYIMVEDNYSKEILDKNIENGKLPQIVAKRLFSSHFEHSNVMEFLKVNVSQKTKEIYLLHLSDGNSDAKQFKQDIQQLTGKMVIVCDV